MYGAKQGRGKRENRNAVSPLCFLPRNATNLAFRLFAPLIRMPLRNFCQVSVHSFSLMKHQISLTNSSCVTFKYSGPSQCGRSRWQMQRASQVCSSQNRLPPWYSNQSLDTVWLQQVGKTKGTGGFQADTVLFPQHLTQYPGM